jgi:uncharacterized membrane protein
MRRLGRGQGKAPKALDSSPKRVYDILLSIIAQCCACAVIAALVLPGMLTLNLLLLWLQPVYWVARTARALLGFVLAFPFLVAAFAKHGLK